MSTTATRKLRPHDAPEMYANESLSDLRLAMFHLDAACEKLELKDYDTYGSWVEELVECRKVINARYQKIRGGICEWTS